jgi:UDP-N-acetylmuramoyl-tripeptide--D-alanyl-D-alanine ligase
MVAAHAARLGIEVVAVGVDLYGVAPVDDPVGALGPLGPGDVVLVKGSLVAGLQPVAQRLAAGAGAGAGGDPGDGTATAGLTPPARPAAAP